MTITALFLATTSLIFYNSGQETYPFRLNFQPEEVLRYRETVTSSSTTTLAGQTEAFTFSGGRTTILKVTKVDEHGVATMSVDYENVNATVRITQTPSGVSQAQRAKVEQQLVEQLKGDLSKGKRTQFVTPRGLTTYRFEAGPNRFIEIINGTFMMLVLPKAPPTMGQNWYIDVSQADPNNSAPMNVNYKLVGASVIAGSKAYKIAFYAQKTEEQKEGDAKATVVLILKGFVNITLDTGRVVGGEITSNVTSKISQGGRTRNQKRITVQRFERV